MRRKAETEGKERLKDKSKNTDEDMKKREEIRKFFEESTPEDFRDFKNPFKSGKETMPRDDKTSES